MKSMNKVFLMGHLGAHPEIRTSKKGNFYTRLSLATNRGYLNGEDQWEQKTDWHSVFVWGPLAERCCHNLRKGSLVLVEGSLTYWKAAMGDEHEGYKNAIHANEVKFLGHSKSAANEGQDHFAGGENLDNSKAPLNHNAVAHPA